MSVEILSTAAELHEKSHLKHVQLGMTLKMTQGHRNCLYSIGYVSLPVSGVYYNISGLH